MSEPFQIPDEVRLAQARATDPRSSAWVSANAGSGKTFVLARRVIRLLLDGAPPAKILCLTFTRAAAAEMSNRVFAILGEWAAMQDAALSAALADILGRGPGAEEIRRARTLFALSLDTPGGLKIQTIHAFCEALLHQFPLEANVSGHFQVLEDGQQGELVAEARRRVVLEIETGASDNPDRLQRLRSAFRSLIDLASDAAIDAALNEVIARREPFLRWAEGDVAGAMAPVWLHAGIDPSCEEAAIVAEALADTGFTDADLLELAALAEATGQKGNLEFAARARAFVGAEDALARFPLRRSLFLTDKGEPRKAPLTKALTASRPGLAEALTEEGERVLAATRRREAWRVLAGSQALFEIGEAILERYRSIKRRLGLADFDDLIAAAGNLLTRSDVRRWVQYKLDRGIDHVLIDEAQDTSPRQWEIVNAIVEDFHSGEGASDRVRTVFAVGDEKQSIYSFQGADPRKFSQEAQALERRAAAADLPFRRVALNLSFRSAPDVLDAVDTVFGDAGNFRGLSATEERTVHQAVRRSDPGEVWIWPLFARQSASERTEWIAPLDSHTAQHPAERLAERIATTVAGWIDRGEKLPGRDRPIRAGDVLVLVRRRDAFSTAIIRRLKEKGVPIAGADRLNLTEHIVSEDLVALGRVMLMPEDDLSLAAVLKSPLFGLDDDDLVALAAGRHGAALFDHLALIAGEEAHPMSARADAIHARLLRLRTLAAMRPPFEFYAEVLGRQGGRRQFLSRLGTEAADVLDAFAQAAMGHERAGLGGLEDFIASLTRASPAIKREIDMKIDEVRVITVHSAKGLEAPIVFLVDPCTPAFVHSHSPAVIEVDAGGPQGAFVWAALARGALDAVAQRDAVIAREAEEEYRRLLYVGMTRAADRLVICGWHGVHAPKHPHWHAMASGALASDAETMADADGGTWLKWTSPRPQTVDARREKPMKQGGAAAAARPSDPPQWLFGEAMREPPVPRPLTPSGAAALIADPPPSPSGGPGETGREDIADPMGEAERRFALARGTATHRLLELLPELAGAERPAMADAWLSRNAADWPAGEADKARSEVLSLLDDASLAHLFGPSSRAEASVAGYVTIGGREILVSGQIDRLAVTPTAVEIADYKTNRDIPAEAGDAPQAYVLQLALYRALLRRIYPGRSVRCMLIWTRASLVARIDDAAMDAALAAITLD